MKEINGFVNIIKPAGITSFAVVAKIRKALGVKRVGHGGTLDPMVTGVLPIALGKATRLCEYLETQGKKYVVTIFMGQETDTQDLTGMILKETDCSHITYAQFLEVLQSFVGEIAQIPPMISAIKQQGVPLYKLARKGIEVERKPRMIRIEEIIPISENWQGAHPTATFWVSCSKGSYMRTLCHDIGQKLGVVACLEKLVRVEAAGFSIEEGISIEDFLAAVEREDFSAIIPMEKAIAHLPKVQVTTGEKEKILHGTAIPWSKEVDVKEPSQEYMVFDSEEKLIASGFLISENGYMRLKVRKVFA